MGLVEDSAHAQRHRAVSSRTIEPANRMANSMNRNNAGAFRALAHASWLLPCAGLAVLGLVDRLAPPTRVAPPLALILGTVGAGATLALIARARGSAGMRREALLGLGANALVLVVMMTAVLAGQRARANAQEEAGRLKLAASTALSDEAGWSGTGGDGPVRLFAAQIDARNELARAVARSFNQPFTLVLVGVDNRAGTTDVTLDLSQVGIKLADGTVHAGLDRALLFAGARSRDREVQRHAAPYPVTRGTALSHAFAFLAPDEAMQDATELVVQLNGRPVVLRGRFVSAAEKQARRRP
jgi:hypothetical protein